MKPAMPFLLLALWFPPSLLAQGKVQWEALYFSDDTQKLLLSPVKAPEPGRVIWEWAPHDGLRQQYLTLVETSFPSKQKFDNKNFGQPLEIMGGVLKITQPRFKNAGYFTLRQLGPQPQILAQYDVTAVQVFPKTSTLDPSEDVTLGCRASKARDSYSLKWKTTPGSDRSGSTTELRFNETSYLIVNRVHHKPGTDTYVCELRLNRTVVHSNSAALTYTVQQNLRSSVFRASVPRSKITIVPRIRTPLDHEIILKSPFTVQWEPRLLAQDRKIICQGQPNGAFSTRSNHFRDRISPFLVGETLRSVKISTTLFQDAGDFEYLVGFKSLRFLRLTTIIVTAESSVSASGGLQVSLTCTASSLPASTRLLWIDPDGREAAATLDLQSNSLTLGHLEIQAQASQWSCVLFEGEILRAVYPYTLRIPDQNYHPSDAIALWVLVGYLGVKVTILVWLCCLFCKWVAGEQKKHQATPQAKVADGRHAASPGSAPPAGIIR
ncbi:uncharacterized protein LOC136752729 [Amia ocellicauda]|uniref:uncharacterized protein LOC136752729 n=1 Tax=Amia ocellicauda TaxID=2972642 RepID=UPI003463CDDD